MLSFKRYFTGEILTKLEHIKLLSTRISKLISKTQVQPQTKHRSFKSLFHQHKETAIKELTPEECEELYVRENELDRLLGDECFVCTAAYIETLDMPFDSLDEASWYV